MGIPISEVDKIATLSRLSFSEAEKEQLQHHLEGILRTAESLSELDTEGVAPTAHIQGKENVMRSDMVQASMDNAVLTFNAPEKENGCFIVPKVVE
jgi:aspartyl-tRNA(Asn)/glutamyl-tRNA(Gln) amidotransferase subunit C